MAAKRATFAAADSAADSHAARGQHAGPPAERRRLAEAHAGDVHLDGAVVSGHDSPPPCHPPGIPRRPRTAARRPIAPPSTSAASEPRPARPNAQDVAE